MRENKAVVWCVLSLGFLWWSGCQSPKVPSVLSADRPILERCVPSESDAAVACGGEESGGLYQRYLLHSWSRAQLPQSKPEVIRKELECDGFMLEIAGILDLPADEVSKLRLSCADPNYVDLKIHGASFEVYRAMSRAIGHYLEWRLNGHTKNFLMTALRDRNRLLTIDGLRLDRPFALDGTPMPISLFQRQARRSRGVSTVSAEFVAVDGEIARVYEFDLGPDGTATFRSSEVRDAKDYDPTLHALLKDAERTATAEMKAKGISGLGACHVFWGLKKRILRERGIEWREPSELNPQTCYD